MRILFLSSVRIPSEKASGLAIVRQCEGFVGNGHQVDLVIPKRNNAVQPSVQEAYGFSPEFSVREIKLPGIYNLGKPGFIFMLMRDAIKMFMIFLKNRKSTDLVYTRDHRLLLPFVLFGYSQKCFLELHTKHTDTLAKFIVRKVKKVIVISEGLKSFYQPVRKEIQVEPSGVNLEQFKNLPPVAEIKKKLSLPNDKFIFGYVGKYQTMGEDKGVNEIIQAFGLALKERQDIFLLLVGIAADEKATVSEVFKETGVSEDAYSILELDQSRFAEYLISSDILLMNYPNTEHYAHFMSPTKLFAYMAAGKPIISSDLPSIRSVVAKDEVLFVTAGDISAYSKGMLNVLGDFKELQTVADEARKLSEKHNWNERGRRIIYPQKP